MPEQSAQPATELQLLQIRQHLLKRHDIPVLCANIEQIGLVWLLGSVADTLNRHNGPKAVGQGIHHRCAHTAARGAAGDDGGIDRLHG